MFLATISHDFIHFLKAGLMFFTCHCWFVEVNVGSGLRVQIVYLESGSGCYDVCHVIDWNGRMPENGYLKCLVKQRYCETAAASKLPWQVWLSSYPLIWVEFTSLSPSLSEALAEGILSSRSGMFSRVALSSLWTTIFSLPFDLSISFLASIKERFSVTVPLIWKNQQNKPSEMTWSKHSYTATELEWKEKHYKRWHVWGYYLNGMRPH